MLVIPAIDLKDGKCVRLRQGRMDDETVFSDDPVAVAERWVGAGARRLHVVDLNGAFAGQPVNAKVIGAMTTAVAALLMTSESVIVITKISVSRTGAGQPAPRATRPAAMRSVAPLSWRAAPIGIRAPSRITTGQSMLS